MSLIIPAIDLLDGKVVRLIKGDYQQVTVYAENPLDFAKKFASAGIRKVHVVDLNGAKSGKIENLKALEAIASAGLEVDFGGGVRTRESVQMALNAGALEVTAGSIATKSPRTVLDWIQEFGADKIVLGADFSGDKIAVEGWQSHSEISPEDLVGTFAGAGIRKVISTNVQLDGMLSGVSLAPYLRLREEFPDLFLIGSGGVRSMEDIKSFQRAGLDGVIVGKAFYEGFISLEEMAKWNEQV